MVAHLCQKIPLCFTRQDPMNVACGGSTSQCYFPPAPPPPRRVWLSGFAAFFLPKSPKFCLPYRWSEAHPRSHHGLTPVLRSWGVNMKRGEQVCLSAHVCYWPVRL